MISSAVSAIIIGSWIDLTHRRHVAELVKEAIITGPVLFRTQLAYFDTI